MVKNLILYGKSLATNDIEGLEITSKNLEDCEIVLLEDASIAATFPIQQSISGKKVYCLTEDIEARGFSKTQILDRYYQISYPELIDLIESADRLISLL